MHHSSNQILLGASYLVIQNKNHTMACKPLQKRIPLYISESESRSLSVVSDTLRPHRLYSPRNSPGQNTGVGSLSLLQGIFPTQGSNPGLLHCRRILYQLSHEEGRIMHLCSSTIHLNNLLLSTLYLLFSQPGISLSQLIHQAHSLTASWSSLKSQSPREDFLTYYIKYAST